MKIKRIQVENNPILGTIEFDFTDQNNQPVDTIILAGENGTGKTTLLEIIYELSQYRFNNNHSSEKRTFDVLFNEEEVALIRDNVPLPLQLQEINPSTITLSFDYTKKSWEQVQVTLEVDGETKTFRGNILADQEVKKIFRSIYSDVEINFTPNLIKSVTAKELDEEQHASIKSGNNLATEITQLLIDIKTLDDADFSEWARNNIGEAIDEKMLEPRIKRFKSAFSFMFPTLNLKSIQNVQGQKKVVFEQFGEEVFLEDLSSGEKQIVFRGGFLLKDQKSNKGIIALIDEPEISLHPDWQLKVLNFYKKLFEDEKDEQTSQIFIATHSPFIIHNYTRQKDKVIVLKKDQQGVVKTDQNASYYSWKKARVVQEAFRINNFLDSDTKKPVLITEGKTDANILRVAWEKLNPGHEIPFLVVASGIEVDESKRTGSADQARRTLELIANISQDRRIIGLFDNDAEGNKCFKGLNKKIFGSYTIDEQVRKHVSKDVYGMLLPVPEDRGLFVNPTDLTQRYLVIEHYFSNEILESENLKGNSILGTEVFKIQGNKNNFSERVRTFGESEFSNFEILFDRIISLLD